MWTLSPLMLVAACLLGQHTVHSMTCLEEVEELLRKQREGKIQDLEFPDCDSSGDYKQKQCYGQWSGHGQCYCVDKKTGQWYPDMEFVSGSSLLAREMTCQCATDKKTAAERKEECELNTGDYKPVTCTDFDWCFCTHRSGNRMHSYPVFRMGESNCLCARAAYPPMPGKSFSCDAIGRYEPKQCRASMCFCVDEMGKRTTKPVPEYGYLQCPSHDK